jgi:hypothetical protein
MDFKKKNSSEGFGKVLGFLIMLVIFSIILFFILKLTHKLPGSWNYPPVLGISIGIVAFGKFIKGILR